MRRVTTKSSIIWLFILFSLFNDILIIFRFEYFACMADSIAYSNVSMLALFRTVLFKKNEQHVGIDESKVCPLAASYDGDIHDALANLRRLDGNIPVHERYGVPVTFFAQMVAQKYCRLHNWVIVCVFVYFQYFD